MLQALKQEQRQLALHVTTDLSGLKLTQDIVCVC